MKTVAWQIVDIVFFSLLGLGSRTASVGISQFDNKHETLCNHGLGSKHILIGKFGIIVAHYHKIAEVCAVIRSHSSFVSSKPIQRAGDLCLISMGG